MKSSVPAPMVVSQRTIEQCRDSIDAPWKKVARRVVNACSSWLFGLEVAEGFQLGLGTRVPRGSRLGRFGYIGRGFAASGPVCVGDLTMISTEVSIVGNDHGTDDPRVPIRLAFRRQQPVTVIDADVWIGHRAILRSGIRVGRGAVIGAGAVFTKDVPPYAVLGGSPARVLRYRFDDAAQRQCDLDVFGFTDA